MGPCLVSTPLFLSPGEGKGYPLQYSGLENSMHCIVRGIEKSLTRLSNFHFHVWTIKKVEHLRIDAFELCVGEDF